HDWASRGLRLPRPVCRTTWPTRSGTEEVGLEETRASFASADRHVRELAGPSGTSTQNCYSPSVPVKLGGARPRARFSPRPERERAVAAESSPPLTARSSPRSRRGRG